MCIACWSCGARTDWLPRQGLFPDLVRRGFLDIKVSGLFGGGWKRRWFVLADNCLYMFMSPEDEDPISVVPLNGVAARALAGESKRPFAFQVRQRAAVPRVSHTSRCRL